MTNGMKALLALGVGAVVVISTYFYRGEDKAEMAVDKAELKVKEQEFKNNWNNWDREPSQSVKKQQTESVAALKSKVKQAEAKRDGLDSFADDLVRGGQQMIRDEDFRLYDAEDARLSGQAVSHVSPAKAGVK